MDPVTLALAGTSLAGGLADLFGGDGGQQERIDQYIKTLEKQREDIAKRGRDRKMELMRMNEAGKKQRLTRANQKAAQAGYDPVSSSYANEEDLDNALYAGIAQTERETEEALRSIDDRIAAVEASRPIEETPLSKFIGGAATGANLGLGMANILKTPGNTAGEGTGNTQNNNSITPAIQPDNTLPNTNDNIGNPKNMTGMDGGSQKVTLNIKENNNLYGGLKTDSYDPDDPLGLNNLFTNDTEKKSWKNKYTTLKRI